MAIHNVFLLAVFLCAYLGAADGLTCNICTGTNGACSGTQTTCTAPKCFTTSISGGAFTSACDPTGLMPLGCNTALGVTTCVTGGSTGLTAKLPVVAAFATLILAVVLST